MPSGLPRADGGEAVVRHEPPRAFTATAPLRLSIAGGGRDLPEHYLGRGCTVIAAALDIRMRVSLPGMGPAAGDTGGLLGLFARRNADLPRPVVECAVGPGAGLGGSGALVVCLVALEHAIQGQRLAPLVVGLEAFKWERELLGEPVGFQDQLIAALGGVCILQADPGGVIDHVCRPDLEAALRDLLGTRLLLVDTGRRRAAANLLRDLRGAHRRLGDGRSGVPALPSIEEWERALLDRDVSQIGELLRRQTAHKSALVPGAVPADLGPLVEELEKAGVTGYKVVGAGGGGFLLLAVAPSSKPAVGHILAAHRLPIVEARLSRKGVSVDAGA